MKPDLSPKRQAARLRRQEEPSGVGREGIRRDRGRSYTATAAKNEFGRLLDEAIRGETVVITKHDAPRAVLISMDRFHALQQVPQVKLDTLSSEFDALLARMQGPEVRAGMERAFRASPEELGKAARNAARRRG
jgi:prevent-host-death family protein